ncbi:DUF4156 domain-containing protein [Vibrio vulnificus]
MAFLVWGKFSVYGVQVECGGSVAHTLIGRYVITRDPRGMMYHFLRREFIPMKKFELSVGLLFIAILSGCAAKPIIEGAEKVELTTERPDRSHCDYLGEVVGSQGNWVTGDFTSNEDLIIGARNELKNKAFQLGANVVYVEGMANTNAWGSLGTTNTTAIGKAFKCEY